MPTEEQKEANREYQRNWRANNTDKVKANSKRWRDKNKDKLRQKSLKWRADNIERSRENSRRWNNNNRDRVRDNNLRRNIGISLEEYSSMLFAQGGVCALYGTDTPVGNGAFHVDHCHNTGSIRGLLCHNCNRGLGYFKDNLKTIEAIPAYLRRNG